ncbi:MAG: hypothetical protein JWN74_2291 [Acidobacteriaceae bacterium]|nr:hypothetical protein [Acidobacteriaceae bacterium]
MATKTEGKMDVSQYDATVDMRDARKKEIEEGELRLSRLGVQRSTAEQILASTDATSAERREAAEVLDQCKARIARLSVLVDRARATMDIFAKRVAAMQPEYNRQQDRRKASHRASAALR